MIKIKNILISTENIRLIDKLDIPLSKFINFLLDNERANKIEDIKDRYKLKEH